MKGHIQVNNTVFITEVPHFSEHYYTKILYLYQKDKLTLANSSVNCTIQYQQNTVNQ